MDMVNVNVNIPKELAPFMALEKEDERALRNAMILYPFIQKGIISHGYAAQILGLSKRDLIELYGSLELPYFMQSEEELQSDLHTLKEIRGRGA